ncbi:MAG: preprotein translocase subunit SecG [Phycisphaeraceae bacterium]|nr:preprotein translocase subunit SecG [Phycisphaeraceae bacterium]
MFMTLAANWGLIWTVIATLAFLLLSVLMILVVLIQRPQGGGLSGAFGSGAGSGQTAFGAKTGDALTVASILIFVLWLLAAIALNYMIRPGFAAEQPAVATPAETPAPAPTGSTPDSTPPVSAPSTTPPSTSPPPATPPADPQPQPEPQPEEPAPNRAPGAGDTPQGH